MEVCLRAVVWHNANGIEFERVCARNLKGPLQCIRMQCTRAQREPAHSRRSISASLSLPLPLCLSSTAQLTAQKVARRAAQSRKPQRRPSSGELLASIRFERRRLSRIGLNVDEEEEEEDHTKRRGLCAACKTIGKRSDRPTDYCAPAPVRSAGRTRTTRAAELKPPPLLLFGEELRGNNKPPQTDSDFAREGRPSSERHCQSVAESMEMR